MKILITNDDGIFSRGIFCLWKALCDMHDVTVVAPYSEQSAVSHSITLYDPIRITPVIRKDGFTGRAVTGTPADCVKAALAHDTFDCVISGINQGHNTSSNIFYSGTVSGASEARMSGIPSMAVSAGVNRTELDSVGAYVARFLDKWAGSEWFRPGVVMNMNYPDEPAEDPPAMRFTRQGFSYYKTSLLERKDPRGNDYYWFTGELDEDMDELSDDGCLKLGLVSVTPLEFDLTDNKTLNEIRKSEVFFGKD